MKRANPYIIGLCVGLALGLAYATARLTLQSRLWQDVWDAEGGRPLGPCPKCGKSLIETPADGWHCQWCGYHAK